MRICGDGFTVGREHHKKGQPPVPRFRARIRRITVVSTGLLAALFTLVALSPVAYAMRVVPNADSGSGQALPVSGPATAGSSGLSGWEVGLIATGAAILASLLTVLVLRAMTRSSLKPATS
jgi:hypothetical protein